MASGIVYLVGAGPGDPGLLTRRGEAVLRAADVVVYDRLVSPALLDLCPPDCERMYVGKEGGGRAVPQTQTTALLIERGLAGKRVVRLKGGDPFVFGRGGEEALALRQAGVRLEVVPGVSSAIAVPAYAGIPVTHRGLSSSVTIATGHEDPTKDATAIDWPGLARGGDTLVFLMGVEHIDEIADRLVQNGRQASEPAALIRWGTTPAQQTVIATLGTIADVARKSALRPPAVLVVGEVVNLGHQLAWFERRPLHGRSILVTRAREQASTLVERLRALGAEAVEFPTIRILPVAEFADLDRVLLQLQRFSWVVFTSPNGVEAAFSRLAHFERDARELGRSRVAAIGPATAAALRAHGIRADLIPSAFTTAAVAEALTPLLSPEDAVLLLRADIAPLDLASALERSQARVENVVAYRTCPSTERQEELVTLLRSGGVDVVTFTSSSTVRNLLASLAGEAQLLQSAAVFCIGPVTAATAREAGLNVTAVASTHTIDGLIASLLEQFAPQPAIPAEVTP